MHVIICGIHAKLSRRQKRTDENSVATPTLPSSSVCTKQYHHLHAMNDGDGGTGSSSKNTPEPSSTTGQVSANPNHKKQPHAAGDRRACDTCYALKEKCSYPTSDADCYRCSRLKKPCTTKRPLRAAGRPRKSRPVKASRMKPSENTPPPRLPIQLRPLGFTEKQLGPADDFLLYSILDSSQFGDLVSKKTSIGPENLAHRTAHIAHYGRKTLGGRRTLSIHEQSTTV